MDGAALRKTGEPQTDENHHLAKVRVAGSNPVFRSNEAAQGQCVTPPGATSALLVVTYLKPRTRGGCPVVAPSSLREMPWRTCPIPGARRSGAQMNWSRAAGTVEASRKWDSVSACRSL
jgi:hypothetical protein